MSEITATAVSMLLAIIVAAITFLLFGKAFPVLSIGLVMAFGFLIGGYLPNTLVKVTSRK